MYQGERTLAKRPFERPHFPTTVPAGRISICHVNSAALCWMVLRYPLMEVEDALFLCISFLCPDECDFSTPSLRLLTFPDCLFTHIFLPFLPLSFLKGISSF